MFVIGLGIVVPLTIQLLAVNHKVKHAPVAPILVIAGGLILRFVIVYAGQFSHWIYRPHCLKEQSHGLTYRQTLLESVSSPGLGLGLVLLASFVVMGRGLGASGAFSSVLTAGLNAVAPDHVANNPAFAEYLGNGTSSPLKDWLVFEVLGVFVGGFLSGTLAHRVTRVVEKGPHISTRGRMLFAFAGGALMGVGARLARGCTSGQALIGGRAAQRRKLGLHDHGVRRRIRHRVLRQEAMAMTAPFYKFGLFGDNVSLVVAFIIGIGFGFFLERAGFNSAKKLTAQFYFTDLTVFKVMFTAIVTALLGVYYLSVIGFVDLSLVHLTPTFLAPQVVGGLVLGMGFVIGGYCPGTACVAVATGRLDAIVFVAGIFAGIFAFGELFPVVSGFYASTSMGELTLPQAAGLPYGLLVFAVVVMALVGFMGAAVGGEENGGTKGGRMKISELLTGLSLNGRLALAAFALGILALFAGSPYQGADAMVNTKELALIVEKGADKVSVDTLAGWIIQGKSDYRLVDLRGAKDFAAYHIPPAENIPLTSLERSSLQHNEKVLVYADDEVQAAQAWMLLRTRGFKGVYVLDGGLGAWKERILFPGVSKDATPAQLAEYARAREVSRFFGGTPQGAAGDASLTSKPGLPTLALPAPATSRPAGAPKKKKKEGC